MYSTRTAVPYIPHRGSPPPLRPQPASGRASDAEDDDLRGGASATTYAYIPRGTLRSITDEGGKQTLLKSDAFNHVITEGDRTYTYDGLDRVLNAKDETGAEVFTPERQR
jgi:YD repeat-containing protein